MALEDLIEQAAAKGLTHLTLYPVQSEDGKKTYWAARATPSTMHSYVQTEATDPVKALTAVLESLPAAKKRKVTATVSEPTREATPEPDAIERDQADPTVDWMLK